MGRRRIKSGSSSDHDHSVGRPRRIVNRRAATTERDDSSTDEEVATPAKAPSSKRGGKSAAGRPETAPQSQKTKNKKNATFCQPNVQLTLRDLVANGIQHVLVSLNKKLPIKKSEILKTMNNQSKDFKAAIVEIGETLDDVFGFKLVGIRQLENGGWEKIQLDKAGFFIAVSQFSRRDIESSNHPIRDKDAIKDAAVVLVLNWINMMRQDVDEDHIWHWLSNTLPENVCERREDFRKFLKRELVDPLYVNRLEVKTNDEITCKYSWGIRAELECDKYELLKQIGQSFEKPIESFKKHFSELLTHEDYQERVASLRDLERELGAGGSHLERHFEQNTEQVETQEILVTQEGNI